MRTKRYVNALEGPVTDVTTELPERHVLVKCPGCRRVIDAAELARDLDVCPRCGHHLRLGARRRIELTVDAGTFEEWDASLTATDFLHFPSYAEKLERTRTATGERDAVVSGQARIGGRRTALFVMNGDFLMGSMGAAVGEKLCRLFERATERGLPVVGFTCSGGARMQEGTTSLMQMAKVTGAVRRHRARGLAYINVLTDPTTGGVTASFAMQGDITLAEPGALVAFAGPRVVEQTTHKRLPAGFQRAEFLLEHGFCDRICPRAELPATIAELLTLLAGGVPDADAPHALEATEPARARRKRRKAASPQTPSAYDIVRGIRSGERPCALTLIEQGFDGFVELHGDGLFGEDAAIVAGIGWTGGRAMAVIACERGRTTKERVARNFGSAHPEGYRKGIRIMRLAERFGLPVLTLIDTAGAYCGIGAEERGQGAAIAQSLMTLSGLTVPVVAVVTGEGGSGGALALGLADRVYMLSGSAYAVVSPEGCASILWKTTDRAPEAAEALNLTAERLRDLGLIDGIIDEGDRTPSEIAHAILTRATADFAELERLSTQDLLDARYQAFRAMGANRIDA